MNDQMRAALAAFSDAVSAAKQHPFLPAPARDAIGLAAEVLGLFGAELADLRSQVDAIVDAR